MLGVPAPAPRGLVRLVRVVAPGRRGRPPLQPQPGPESEPQAGAGGPAVPRDEERQAAGEAVGGRRPGRRDPERAGTAGERGGSSVGQGRAQGQKRIEGRARAQRAHRVRGVGLLPGIVEPGRGEPDGAAGAERDVVGRRQALDLVSLEQGRLERRGGLRAGHVAGLGEHLEGAFAVRVQVPAHALPQAGGLADVEHGPARAVEAVDARALGQRQAPRPRQRPLPRGAPGRRREPGQELVERAQALALGQQRGQVTPDRGGGGHVVAAAAQRRNGGAEVARQGAQRAAGQLRQEPPRDGVRADQPQGERAVAVPPVQLPQVGLLETGEVHQRGRRAGAERGRCGAQPPPDRLRRRAARPVGQPQAGHACHGGRQRRAGRPGDHLGHGLTGRARPGQPAELEQGAPGEGAGGLRVQEQHRQLGQRRHARSMERPRAGAGPPTAPPGPSRPAACGRRTGPGRSAGRRPPAPRPGADRPWRSRNGWACR